ncbi:TPA: aminotransferase class V-fold PLP-dependent enzyme, partial [Candidatus Bathyarchaeota archaeon]|nr:aminotransferase class V-fold PLP-dependent enzyme [Candidatus Bathyarchaeota archaeon]
VIVHGPKDGRRSPAIACCSFRYIEGESIMLHLDLHGISVATGSACATRKLEPSHVLTAIGVDPEVAHGAIKFSLSWHNTEDDIDYVLDVLPGVVERLRRISPLRPGRP